MTLIEQLRTIAYTFIFGIFFSFIFNLLYRVLFTKKNIINLFTNFFFFFLTSSIYFYFLYMINGGIVNYYMLLIFLISFFLYNHLFKKIRNVGWWFNILEKLLNIW